MNLIKIVKVVTMYADLENVVLRKMRLKFSDVILYKNKLLLIGNACAIEFFFSIDTRLFSLFSI